MPLLPFAPAPGKSSSSPLTTKGDLFTHGSVDSRLAVGSNGFILTADSTQTLGIGWGTAPVNFNAQQLSNASPATLVPALQFTALGSTYEGPNLADVGVMIHSETTYSVGNNPSIPGISYSDIRSSPTMTGVTAAGNVEIYGGSFTPTLAGTSAGGCANFAGIAVNAVAGGGTVTTGFAHRSIFTNNGATVTTAVVFDGQLLALSGTIGTSIGLRLTSLGGTTIWGIQVGAYNNYFAGSSSFGSTGTPSFTVDATGSVRATASLLAGPSMPTTQTNGGTLSANPDLVTNETYTTTLVTSEYFIPCLLNDTITTAGTASNAFVYGLGVYPKLTASSGTTGLSVAGIACIPTFTGTDTYANINGLNLNATISAPTTASIGVSSTVLVSASTTTTLTGFKFSSVAFGGTITTCIGLDLTSLAGTTKWGMKVGNYQSYHQGAVAFGAAAAPVYGIDLQALNSGSLSAIGVAGTSSAPANPSSNQSWWGLWKGTTNYYFVVAFNDAGTMRFVSLGPLNGAGAAALAKGTSLPA